VCPRLAGGPLPEFAAGSVGRLWPVVVEVIGPSQASCEISGEIGKLRRGNNTFTGHPGVSGWSSSWVISWASSHLTVLPVAAMVFADLLAEQRAVLAFPLGSAA
jgi:hypothetical protein